MRTAHTRNPGPVQRTLTDEERLDWLRLIRSDNIGPITFHRLIQRFGTIADAIEQAPVLARRGGSVKPFRIMSREAAENEAQVLHALGGFMLASCEPDYPQLLRMIEDAPPVISVLGKRDLLNKGRCIAMIGSRNATLNGRQFTERLARDCGQAGFTLVSGMARGIDASAHRGGMSTGTIAVVAGGVDVVYPEENQPLYDEIAQKGIIIAESPFATPPTNRHFPRRNRIISGLCEGVIVVEAVEHSGSLITANFALEQGREVLAVPGSPLDPRAKGSNNLLRQGATLVENVQDILDVLSRHTPPHLAEPPLPFYDALQSFGDDDLSNARTKILASLSPVPVRVDDLIRDVELPAALVLAALLELELAGKAARQPGQLVCLIG